MKRTDIRRVAMQALYQLDVRGEADVEEVRATLKEGPESREVHEPAFELALSAWRGRAAADALTNELAPQWPTNRQPPVDRAILRLAYHEIVSGHAPAKVAINEAIELAKAFGSEDSPAFVNGVLDKMAKRIAEAQQPPKAAAPEGDAWLNDAVAPPPKDQ